MLKSLKEIDPELLVIVITGFGSVESAVEALKLGAFHYMKKPFKADALRVIVKLALQTQILKREVRNLRKGDLELFEKVPIVGASAAFKEMIHQVRELSVVPATGVVVPVPPVLPVLVVAPVAPVEPVLLAGAVAAGVAACKAGTLVVAA